jgi:chitinase
MPGFQRHGWPLIVLMALAGLSGCSPGTPNGQGKEVETTKANTVAAGWFGGYLDVTILPGLRLDESSPPGTVTTLLAFVTSDPARPCEPSWGGFYDLDRASEKLALDAQVTAFRKSGHDVAVSFGGQRGPELAAACTDPEALVRAYRTVITRYGVNTVDLDIEGPSASDRDAATRRAAAIARLQAERPPNSPLKVWLTLPVSGNGLTPAAVTSVETMLEAGVELTGINIMTMNFGHLAPGASMGDTAVGAAEATHRMLSTLYENANRPIDDASLWNRIGLTPMVGVNDVAGNVFTLDDAKELNSFALERGVGRMSMWSLNRDAACTTAAGEQGQTHSSVASDCSGIAQEAGMFAKVLGSALSHQP